MGEGRGGVTSCLQQGELGVGGRKGRLFLRTLFWVFWILNHFNVSPIQNTIRFWMFTKKKIHFYQIKCKRQNHPWWCSKGEKNKANTNHKREIWPRERSRKASLSQGCRNWGLQDEMMLTGKERKEESFRQQEENVQRPCGGRSTASKGV